MNTNQEIIIRSYQLGKTYRKLVWNHAGTVCEYDELESAIPVNPGNQSCHLPPVLIIGL